MKRTCIQCGREFELSEEQIRLYEEKELEIPKRCYHCRRSNRIRNYDVVVPKGVGRKGKNHFGIGRAIPGMFAILLLFAAYTFGRSFLTEKDTPSGPRTDTITTQTAISGNYIFRSFDLLNEHYEKHGWSMGFTSAEKYLAAANKVIADPNSLHKKEKEDGDDIFYLAASNDLVIISTDGYIRTYFRPEDGMDYYNRQ